MELSPYDEVPVHQTPRPLSMVSSIDPGFDDGYFFGVFNAQAQTFLFCGLRINPNTDLVGGYVGLIRRGGQRTLRVSRTWRELCDTVVGPFRIRIAEPYRDLHLTLDQNESGLAMDLHWLGASPAYTEAHHWATNRGRPTTDQTRYVQAGIASGWISVDGERIPVEPERWWGSRDPAWGLCFERPPLAPCPRWLPPRAAEGVPRALRFWTLFGSTSPDGSRLSGFYAIHEDPDGRRVPMNWVPSTIGYQAGSWKDSGSMRTYHGPGVSVEFDEFDFSTQPVDHELYDGTKQAGLIGKEYVSEVVTTAPDGRAWTGAGHTELFLDGRFAPYGLSAKVGRA